MENDKTLIKISKTLKSLNEKIAKTKEEVDLLCLKRNELIANAIDTAMEKKKIPSDIAFSKMLDFLNTLSVSDFENEVNSENEDNPENEDNTENEDVENIKETSNNEISYNKTNTYAAK